ncbi:MAG: protoporphyrinogen/coproporphyrinogen oxidase [Thermoleophilaceae bacterium]|nr:protoporphyrinogen/coproporphyrinogen oxidase [Thermoleophilaceae bacterium]
MDANGNSDGSGGPRVAVIGGGIAGISAADRLRAAGARAEIFEAGDRLGGRIGVDRLGDREACLGGKNIGRRYREFKALTERGAEGGRRWEFFGPETMQVMPNGRLLPMSYRRISARVRLGGRMLLRGQIPSARRFSKLARQVKTNEPSGFLGDGWFAELARKRDHPTLADYFGAGFSSAVVRHTTVRMNGAEPDEAWVGNFGSNLALVVDKFDQLTDGLEPVMRAAAARHGVHLNAPVERLLARDGRVTGLATQDGHAHEGFGAVVMAVPASIAAPIVAPLDRDLAAMLYSIVYHPVAVVVAEYDRPVFPQQYAAIATPHHLALSNAGAYGLDDRHIVRFTFSGRAARGRIEPDTFDPEALLAEAEEFLSRYLPIGGARRVNHVSRAFEPGLCSYRRDHEHFLRAVDGMLGSMDGLALAGDYMQGASLEACTRSGVAAADRLTGARLPMPVEAAGVAS